METAFLHNKTEVKFVKRVISILLLILCLLSCIASSLPVSAETASNEQNAVNLTRAYLSSNKHFLFWYTEEGEQAVSSQAVKDCAEALEQAIIQYDSLFNTSFHCNSTIIYDGVRSVAQKVILISTGIDERYLTEALNIYVCNLPDNTHGMYRTNNTTYWADTDEYGVVLSSYMLLNAKHLKNGISSCSYHELFHYYQNWLIYDDGTQHNITDDLIGEATANWAASMVYPNTSCNDILNLECTNYLKHAHDILSNMRSEHGDVGVGYALAKLLYSYENCVSNGRQKIINAIYEPDALTYLHNNSTEAERKAVISDLAKRNLTSNYPNNNYFPNSNGVLKIAEFEIARLASALPWSKKLGPMGIKYIRITKEAINKYDIEFKLDDGLQIEVLDENNNYQYLSQSAIIPKLDTDVIVAIENPSLLQTKGYKMIAKERENDNIPNIPGTTEEQHTNKNTAKFGGEYSVKNVGKYGTLNFRVMFDCSYSVPNPQKTIEMIVHDGYEADIQSYVVNACRLYYGTKVRSLPTYDNYMDVTIAMMDIDINEVAKRELSYLGIQIENIKITSVDLTDESKLRVMQISN